MASFIRIADIPPDELHLLPIIALRQQIREDRNRPRPLNGRTDQSKRDGSRPGRAHFAEVPAAKVWPAVGGRVVTDWRHARCRLTSLSQSRSTPAERG